MIVERLDRGACHHAWRGYPETENAQPGVILLGFFGISWHVRFVAGRIAGWGE